MDIETAHRLKPHCAENGEWDMWKFYLYRDMSLNGAHFDHVRAFYAFRLRVA